MKWVLTIILFLYSSAFTYGEVTIFSDSFNDTSKISLSSNILLTNSIAVLSNINNDGVLYSINITKKSNEKWTYFYVNYEITNSGLLAPQINFIIYPINSSSIEFTNHIKDISSISVNKLTIKAELIKGTGANKGTPLLKEWHITVTTNSSSDLELSPQYENKFYAAPSPFKISDSSIRFYYSFSEESYITLDIYDINYSLVKELCVDKKYTAGSFLDEQWNGKNGDGYSVLSGLYVAKLIIKDTNKNIKNTLTFPFAVIK